MGQWRVSLRAQEAILCTLPVDGSVASSPVLALWASASWPGKWGLGLPTETGPLQGVGLQASKGAELGSSSAAATFKIGNLGHIAESADLGFPIWIMGTTATPLTGPL